MTEERGELVSYVDVTERDIMMHTYDRQNAAQQIVQGPSVALVAEDRLPPLPFRALPSGVPLPQQLQFLARGQGTVIKVLLVGGMESDDVLKEGRGMVRLVEELRDSGCCEKRGSWEEAEDFEEDLCWEVQELDWRLHMARCRAHEGFVDGRRDPNSKAKDSINFHPGLLLTLSPPSF
jgi:hypothetical protein